MLEIGWVGMEPDSPGSEVEQVTGSCDMVMNFQISIKFTENLDLLK